MLKKQAEAVENESSEGEVNQYESEDENGDDNSDSSAEQLNSRLEELYRLREEDDILRCQVEALKNELNEMRAVHAAEMEQRNRILSDMTAIKRVIDNRKKALLNLHQKRLKEREEAGSKKLPASKKRKEGDSDKTNVASDQVSAASTSSSADSIEKEAHLISLISVFLHLLPFGASVDFICTYLQQWDSTVTTKEIENLMEKHPSIFKKNSVSVDGTSNESWSFISFQK